MPASPKTILFTSAALSLLLMFVGNGPSTAVSARSATAVWPLVPEPEVVAGFDPPDQGWDAGHRGVDLSGVPRQSVRAARSGLVTYAGLLAGRGVVVVSHGSTRTTYQPVDASVRVGDHVKAGQKVGALVSFGSHCWPRTCLHWGLIRGETYLNPLTLVGAGPVRLLPLYVALGTFGLEPAFPRRATTPMVRVPMPGGVLGGRPSAVGPW